MWLCQQCRTISTTTLWLGDREGIEVYTHTTDTFHQAVLDQCYFCTRVNEALGKHSKATTDHAERHGISCYLSVSHQGVEVLNKDALHTLEEFSLDKAFEFEFGRRTDHPNTWGRIKQWHKKCRETHTLCNGQQSILKQSHLPSSYAGKWLPTRLLETKLSDGDDNAVRIVNTANLTTKERSRVSYLTLSHCWGRQPFLRLTQDNEAELLNSFPTDHEDLPLNFRDAIYATRQLGFQYIWIDSLCIMQGQGGDWVTEAPLMDKVFTNAELCLAAAASWDSMGGLFRDRDLTAVSPFKIELSVSATPATPLQEKLPFQLRFLFDVYGRNERPGHKWRRLIDECPLNTRGWVQQERVLAPRTIHFAADQVCWECKELQAYETGRDDAMRDFESGMVKNWETAGTQATAERQKLYESPLFFGQAGGYEDEMRMLAMQNVLEPVPDVAYKAWRRIIGKYSSCQLSHESDKLVAASGLAKAFAQHLRGEGMETEYLAGLWRGYLVDELLWYRRPGKRAPLSRDDNIGGGKSKNMDQTGGRRPKEYRAPSWSWASIDGPIEWPVGLWFAQVIRVARVTSTRVDLLDDCVGVVPDPTMRVKYGEVTLQTYLVEQTRMPAEFRIQQLFDVEGEEVETLNEQLLFAPLYLIYDEGWGRWNFGLILVEVGKDDGRQKFKRVGMFRVNMKSKEEEDKGKGFDKQWYEDKDKREVTIV